MHVTEIKLYSIVSEMGVIPLVKIYYSQLMEEDQPGIIIMEDLVERSGIQPVAQGFTVEQVRRGCF